MKKYDITIWDVDGTLLDTREGVLESVCYTIRKQGFKIPDINILETFIGPPIQSSFQRQYSLSDEKANEMASIFRERYKECDLYRAKVYKGIIELFKVLKSNQVQIAIATYKREDYAKKIVEHFGINKYTSVICGSDFEGKLKKKDIIQKSISLLGGGEDKRILMIGDSANDAKGAEALGIDFLGVTYGYGFKSKEDVNVYQNIGCANEVKEIEEKIL